jgi:hypothetical protein
VSFRPPPADRRGRITPRELGFLFLVLAVIVIVFGALILYNVTRPPGFGDQRGTPLPAVTMIDNQVAPWQLPASAIQAAAASWGVSYETGGAPACGEGKSPPGVAVICVQPVPCRCYSFSYYAGGIVLDPRLVGAPAWEIQEAAGHEIGFMLGYSEESPSAPNVMARAMTGYLNLPGQPPVRY